MSNISRTNRDKANVESFSVTVHNVHVDLTSILAQFDPTDQVVLVIGTPSGRPKRVTLTGNFLVSPMPTDY